MKTAQGAKTAKTKKSTKKKTTPKNSKALVDQVLVKLSPQLQQKIEKLIATLETSKEGKMGDLTFLASKILMRAQEISRGIRQSRKKKDK